MGIFAKKKVFNMLTFDQDTRVYDKEIEKSWRETVYLTLINVKEGMFNILRRKIAIFPQPTIRFTWDQSVNSCLSVVDQQKTQSGLSISVYFGGPTMFLNFIFHVAKMRFSANFPIFDLCDDMGSCVRLVLVFPFIRATRSSRF